MRRVRALDRQHTRRAEGRRPVSAYGLGAHVERAKSEQASGRELRAGGAKLGESREDLGRRALLDGLL